MGLSRTLYLILLCAVGAARLAELQISKRNQSRLKDKGARKEREPHFRWMVVFHTAILLGAATEVFLLDRPLLPWLAIVSGCLFIAANIVRWWVIRAMQEHWNVEVMNSTALGVVSTGPFRWIRHPNYAAVFIEMITLPLIHTAWITAAAGAILHVIVLRNRLRVEDPALMSNPAYRGAMGHKPRFIPW
jgi:methyltransferase